MRKLDELCDTELYSLKNFKKEAKIRLIERYEGNNLFEFYHELAFPNLNYLFHQLENLKSKVDSNFVCNTCWDL